MKIVTLSILALGVAGMPLGGRNDNSLLTLDEAVSPRHALSTKKAQPTSSSSSITTTKSTTAATPTMTDIKVCMDWCENEDRGHRTDYCINECWKHWKPPGIGTKPPLAARTATPELNMRKHSDKNTTKDDSGDGDVDQKDWLFDVDIERAENLYICMDGCRLQLHPRFEACLTDCYDGYIGAPRDGSTGVTPLPPRSEQTGRVYAEVDSSASDSKQPNQSIPLDDAVNLYECNSKCSHKLRTTFGPCLEKCFEAYVTHDDRQRSGNATLSGRRTNPTERKRARDANSPYSLSQEASNKGPPDEQLCREKCTMQKNKDQCWKDCMEIRREAPENHAATDTVFSDSTRLQRLERRNECDIICAVPGNPAAVKECQDKCKKSLERFPLLEQAALVAANSSTSSIPEPVALAESASIHCSAKCYSSPSTPCWKSCMQPLMDLLKNVPHPEARDLHQMFQKYSR